MCFRSQRRACVNAWQLPKPSQRPLALTPTAHACPLTLNCTSVSALDQQRVRGVTTTESRNGLWYVIQQCLVLVCPCTARNTLHADVPASLAVRAFERFCLCATTSGHAASYSVLFFLSRNEVFLKLRAKFSLCQIIHTMLQGTLFKFQAQPC